MTAIDIPRLRWVCFILLSRQVLITCPVYSVTFRIAICGRCAAMLDASSVNYRALNKWLMLPGPRFVTPAPLRSADRNLERK